MNIFEHRKFRIEQTIKDIEKYANAKYQSDDSYVNKPFYHYNEWFGWRFYLKALKYRDWKSIKKQIKLLLGKE